MGGDVGNKLEVSEEFKVTFLNKFNSSFITWGLVWGDV